MKGTSDIMAADTNMLDFSLSLELLDILHEGTIDQGIPLSRVVNYVDHAYFDMVGAQKREKVFETFFALFNITGALIRIAIPPTADMALNDHSVASALQSIADIASNFRIGVVDIDIVHTAIKHHIHKGPALRRIHFFKSGTANADFAHLKPCIAQRAESHAIGRNLILAATGRHRQNDSKDRKQSKKMFHNKIFTNQKGT